MKTDTLNIGYLFIKGKIFYTLERPWLDNKRNKSCIPVGKYPVNFLKRSNSGKYKDVFHVEPVAGRSGILIHNGNLVSHTRGCIILGLKYGHIGKEKAVLNSRTAMKQLNSLINKQSFSLEILG